MLNKTIKIVSFIILGLAGLSLFGYYIEKSMSEDADDAVSKSLKEFVSLPKKVETVVTSKEIRNVPPTFEMNRHLKTLKNLKRDVYGLNSEFDNDAKEWMVKLFNFKNDSVIHTWSLGNAEFVKNERLYPNAEPRNPILLEGRNIIVGHDETNNLYRLDENSNVLWHNSERRYHHSMNLGPDGNIWVCGSKLRFILVPRKEDPRVYEDELLMKIDVETGEILEERSVADILMNNGYRNFVFGFTNRVEPATWRDPLHLNDIELAYEDGPYWKKGDMFLSLRHRSLVILYRPGTDKIIRLIFGPFLNQHDVDILNDSTISIFNNEGTCVGAKPQEKDTLNRVIIPADTVSLSNIIHYNFSNSTFTYDMLNHFKEHKIYTETQGFHQYLSDGLLYVEQHDHGKMFFMDESTVYYKSQGTNWLGDDWVERPHWVRLYEDIEF